MSDRRRREWSEALAALGRRKRELADGLSPEQLNWNPAPGRWSVAQCLDHLNVTMGIYLDPMEPILETAERRGDEPYGRGTWIGRQLVGALRKPGKRFPAPPSFRPRRGDLPPDDVLPEFDRRLGRLQRAVERGEGLALGEILMPWPVFRWLKLSIAQAFDLQVLHLGRHLDQAERVTREEGFPG